MIKKHRLNKVSTISPCLIFSFYGVMRMLGLKGSNMAAFLIKKTIRFSRVFTYLVLIFYSIFNNLAKIG